jgi:hypothetical protein
MLMDKQNTMSDDQDLAIAAGSVLSDFSIDLGASATDSLGNTVISDIGRGSPVDLLVQVTETFVGANGTLKAELVMADNAALTSNLVVLQDSGAIPVASLIAGYQFRLRIPAGISKRYLGLRYTVAVTTQTAGKVTATLLLDRQTNPTV